MCKNIKKLKANINALLSQELEYFKTKQNKMNSLYL